MGRGISLWGHEALGAGWLDGDQMMKMDGAPKLPDVRTSDLAQRALADAFGQLARVGEAGAQCCMRHGYVTLPYPRSERVGRDVVLQYLTAAEGTMSYARMLLGHLPDRGEPLTPEELHAAKVAEVEMRARLDEMMAPPPPQADGPRAWDGDLREDDPAPFTGGKP